MKIFSGNNCRFSFVLYGLVCLASVQAQITPPSTTMITLETVTETPSTTMIPNTTKALSTTRISNTTNTPLTTVKPNITETLSTTLEPNTTATLSTTLELNTAETLSTTLKPNTLETLLTTLEPNATQTLSTTLEPNATETLSTTSEPNTTGTHSLTTITNKTEPLSTTMIPNTTVTSSTTTTQLTPRKPSTTTTLNATIIQNTTNTSSTSTTPITTKTPSTTTQNRNNTVACPAEKDYMGTYWKTSPTGMQISSCPQGFTGWVSRFCDENGIYQTPIYNCTSNELNDIRNEFKEANSVLNSTNVLARLVSATAADSRTNGTLHIGDVDIVNEVLSKITDAIGKHSTQVLDLADPFLTVANNLLRENTTPTWTTKINKTGEGVNTLMDNIDRFVERIVDVTHPSNISSAEFSKTNLYLKLGSTASCVKSMSFPDRGKDKAIPKWTQDTHDTVDILCNFEDTMGAYSGVIYRNLSNLIPLATTKSSDSAGNTKPMILDAPVISFSFLPRDDSELNTQVQITFQLFTKSLIDPVCTFWRKGNSSGDGYWSNDGCWLANYDKEEGIVVCKCDHLTNFAVLMSPSSISAGDNFIALSVISMVGCIISMIALLITVIVHIIFWRHVKSVKTIINVNLCCTLFVAYLLFLAGINQTDNKDACTAIAALLHFVYLAAFFIMLAEGFNLLHCVFKPLSTRKPGIPLLIAAYVLAAFIVAVSMGSVRLDGYGTSSVCWLSTETGLIWAFVGPVLFILAINFVIVSAVIWRMCGTAAISRKTNIEKAKAGLRSLLVLMPLMGLTWMFGVFSINKDTIVFQYLFAIFNTLQGLFIFIFHCCMSHKIQEVFRRMIRYRTGKLFISSSSETILNKSAATKTTSNTEL